MRAPARVHAVPDLLVPLALGVSGTCWRQQERVWPAYASSITVGSVWKRRAPAEGGGTAVGRSRPWAGSPSPAREKRCKSHSLRAGEVLTRQGGGLAAGPTFVVFA